MSLRDWATNNQNCEDAILMDQSYTFSIVMEKPMVLVAWVVPWNTTYDYLYKPSFLDICYKCLTKMYVMVEFFGWNHLQQGIHINIPFKSRYFSRGGVNPSPYEIFRLKNTFCWFRGDPWRRKDVSILENTAYHVVIFRRIYVFEMCFMPQKISLFSGRTVPCAIKIMLLK